MLYRAFLCIKIVYVEKIKDIYKRKGYVFCKEKYKVTS
ncbi:hypothetical protein RSJ21_01220 [Clostridium botulinum]|uniref:Uncharacterized protein n=4 Tax=Clostridium TaxID=1485 RepID=A0A0L9ZVR5_CLOBO|nr:hypothetical protein CLB_0154 [Clostridium botulinum A str. ATCC 19397]ABS37708.1 hypothetical protein CLC_0166 [Clostridium botulinum A str. Hall]ABS42863.1 hypothetical protein CLI_0173 [Clostridium botulinum F str. Langeland]ACA46514.1 hypothetical protein CLD_0668 [Clostridium botulinum B1 str. Okra]ADF97959.1 hypothetical protein CBF_0146 [Clostridium botulinum F str. 230613]AUM86282.1 hypothetical protein RSJ15_00725 [Clostridium botulinum]NFK36778.1 hypothetical protein [Clostridium